MKSIQNKSKIIFILSIILSTIFFYINPSLAQNSAQKEPAFDVFKHQAQLQKMIDNYQNPDWAKQLPRLSERALTQEYIAIESMQNYLTLQQQQKQQKIQALLSAYQALKTQQAFKDSEKLNK